MQFLMPLRIALQFVHEPERHFAAPLATIWLVSAALPYAILTGADPVLPSSFAVGTAAQTTIAVAASNLMPLSFKRMQAIMEFTHFRLRAMPNLGG